MSRVIVLGDETGFTARVTVIPGAQVVTLDAETVGSERFDLLRGLDPDVLPGVIFLCDGIDKAHIVDLASRTTAAYPTIQLVVVGEPQPQDLLDLMKAGVRDVIAPDADEASITEILRRAATIARAAHPVAAVPVDVAGATAPAVEPKDSRIITVISPKGGVGKTNISTNLALGLAEIAPNDVVLVDLDLQFGDVASALDLSPVQTMEHALVSDAASDPLLLKAVLTQHHAGLFVLCGAESPAATENATSGQIIALLNQLSMQFSNVVVDTAAGLDEPTLAALECTDDVVLVSTMDVSCVRSVRKAADLLMQLGLLPPSRTLTLNMADKQSGLRVKDIEAVIGMPVDVVIPRSGDVQLASNHGQPLMLRKKRGGPFVKGIGNLVTRLRRQGEVTESKHRRLEVA